MLKKTALFLRDGFPKAPQQAGNNSKGKKLKTPEPKSPTTTTSPVYLSSHLRVRLLNRQAAAGADQHNKNHGRPREGHRAPALQRAQILFKWGGKYEEQQC